MIVTLEDIKLINFPIYGLPSDELEVSDGLLRHRHYVVDDRNQIGKTLGVRRLQTPHVLQKLKFCYLDIPDLFNAKHSVFVDTKGFCFIYQKTKFVNVKYHKILKVIPKDTVCILKVSGVSFPVVVKRPPPLGKTWVAMLYLDKRPWHPYRYSEECYKSMKRKI